MKRRGVPASTCAQRARSRHRPLSTIRNHTKPHPRLTHVLLVLLSGLVIELSEVHQHSRTTSHDFTSSTVYSTTQTIHIRDSGGCSLSPPKAPTSSEAARRIALSRPTLQGCLCCLPRNQQGEALFYFTVSSSTCTSPQSPSLRSTSSTTTSNNGRRHPRRHDAQRI